MASIQKSIRLPEDAVQHIETYAKTIGMDFSGVVRDLLVEAVKMRRCPGIVFTDGPAGRRARIAGTGIDVWELIAAFKGMEEDYGRLKAAYHWLNEAQLRSALAYYALYPEDIEELVERNENATEARVLERFPFLKELGTRS